MIEIGGRKLCESCFEEVGAQPCPVCGYDPSTAVNDPTMLAPGSILIGKYIIGRAIGKGGFGITYLALDNSTGKKVAVKEYYPFGLAIRNSGDPTVAVTTEENADVFRAGAERFYEEAKLVSRFNGNPNIVGVHEFFYENDTVYFSMEYLQGRTLKEYVQKQGLLTAPQALFLAYNVTNALMAAHSTSVLHRDISPDNIMLCSNGDVKLIDFGAARQVLMERSQSLSVILKPGFAPLEQYQKKGRQGPWTDIYSLGATMYYALTGEIPDDPMTRLEDDSTFSENRFGIEPKLWDVILRAVQLKISDRYADVFVMRSDLSAVDYQPQPIIVPQQPAISADVAFPTAMPFGSTHRTQGSTVRSAPEEQTIVPPPVPAGEPSFAAAPEETPMPVTTPVPEEAVPPVVPEEAVPPVVPVETGEFPAAVQGPEPSAPKKRLPKKAFIAAGGTVAAAAAAVIIAVSVGRGDGSVPVQETVNSGNYYSGTTVPSASESVPEIIPTEDDQEPEEPETTSRTSATTTTRKTTKSTTPEPDSEPPEDTTTSSSGSSTPEVTTTTSASTSAAAKPPATVDSVKIGGKSYSTDLESLTIEGAGLKNSDVADLKYMTNLDTLILNDNNISDISFVKYMPKLKYLYFHNNNVSDISAVKKLTGLVGFGANNNPISDISVLSGMKKLDSLWLCDTKITSLNAIRGCTRLTSLGVNNCAVSGSVSVLKKMDQLQRVCLAGCGISDISFLSGKPDLSYIYLGDNRISNVSPLWECESINELYLDYNNITESSFGTFNGLTVNGIISMKGMGLTEAQVADIASTLSGELDTIYY